MSFIPEKEWKEEQKEKSQINLGEKEVQVYPRNWEIINEFLKRLKVPNGWIVRSKVRYETVDHNRGSESMCFIPDPNYEWRLENDSKSKS